MKCYVHPKLNAVGVCSTCGRGVCKSCAVFVGGKLYCKQDVEKFIEKDQDREAHKRGTAITVASVFTYIDGLAGMTAGFVLVMIGILGQSPQATSLMSALQPLFKYFSAFSSSPGPLITNLGFLVLLVGSADVGAGYYLWRSSKASAIASVVISIIGAIVILIYLGSSSVPVLVASVYLITAVVKSSAIAAGRKHLL